MLFIFFSIINCLNLTYISITSNFCYHLRNYNITLAVALSTTFF
nr:MAG TPA: hypothetical protein [Caudoviricetes sp.]